MKKNKLLFLVILLQFFVFVFFNGFGVLSTDDIGTVHTTSQEFSKVWTRAIEFEQQAPLYFMVMNIWRSVSDSLIWAKLFNYLIFAISTIYFYKIIEIIFPEKKDRYIVLVFFVLHPFLFYFSNDLRRYSLTLLFGLISLYYVIKIYIAERGKKRDHFLLAIFATLGIFNDYYHAFLLAALGFGLLFISNRKKWFYFLEMLAPFAAFLFLLRIILFQLESADQWSFDHLESGIFFASLKHTVYLIESQTYTLPFSNPDPLIKMLFRVIFIAPLLYFLRKEIFIKGDLIKQNMLLFASAIFMVAVYLLTVNVLKSTGYMIMRYTAFSFPVLFLCFFILVLRFFEKYNKLYIKTGVLGILLILYMLGYQAVYNKYKSFENLKETALWAEEIHTGTSAFVLNSKYAAMMNYYIQNSDRKVIAIPEEMSFEIYDFGARYIRSEEQIHMLFNQKMHGSKEFYVLLSHGDAVNENYNATLLYSYLANNYEQISKEKKSGFFRYRFKSKIPSNDQKNPD